MNPDSLREAKEIFLPVKRGLQKFNKIDVVVCPPTLFLNELAAGAEGVKHLAVGGQDAFWEESGAYTGQISAAMLRKAGAKYVLLGHSERRALGDSDGQINLKIKAALKEGLKVILCVGEQTRDDHGFYLKTLKQQVEEGLKNVQRKFINQLIVAYEPVWAIGIKAKASDTPAGFQEQSIYIKKIVSSLFGNGVAHSLPVLYGGSVSPKNAAEFLGPGQADGLLVGRASLEASDFVEILKIANAS